MSDSLAQKQGPSGAAVMRISDLLHLGNILAEFHLLATLSDLKVFQIQVMPRPQVSPSEKSYFGCQTVERARTGPADFWTLWSERGCQRRQA